jgi:Holliday junction resolvasome RuvABC ATP-dependent DNA helicase subunit
MLKRTPRGRTATRRAWEHLGLEQADDGRTLF